MSEEVRQDEVTSPLASKLCLADPLAQALSVLEPRPTGLNRDALMFAAGAADRDRDVSFWRRMFYAQSSVLTLVVGLGLTGFALRSDVASQPQAARPTVAVPASPITPIPVSSIPSLLATDDSAAWNRYRELRQTAIREEWDHLPSDSAIAPRADVAALQQALQLPRDVLAVPILPKPQSSEK